MTDSRAPKGSSADPPRGVGGRLGRREPSASGSGARLSRALVVGARGEIADIVERALTVGQWRAVQVADADRAMECLLDGSFSLVMLALPWATTADAASLLRFCGYRGALVALVTDGLPPDGAPPTRPKGVDAMIRMPAGPAELAALVDAAAGTPDAGPAAAPDMDQVPGFEDLLDDYLGALLPALERMRAFAAGGDVPGLRGELHVLKGDAGMFGFPAISRQSQQILAMFRAGHRQQALTACGALFLLIEGAAARRTRGADR